jgi:hypothetical protein
LNQLRAVLGCASVAVSFAFVGACGRPVAEDECRTLIERYTELLVKEEEPAASPERVARVQTEVHAAAEKNPQFQLAECSKKVSRRNYECAMQAGSVDAIERCLVF